MIYYLKKITKIIFWLCIKILPFTRSFYETRDTQTPITFKIWFMQRILGFNRNVYWQVHFSSVIANYRNIIIGIETSPGMMPGCYIQGNGKVYIGDYTQIAANVGIISANHGMTDNRISIQEYIKIGKYCWIGMNSVILPNVCLGDFTIVGAGSIVTKSFSEGYCVIAGNPARKIKELNKSECFSHKSKYEYIGYIPKSKFNTYREKHLNI